MDQLKIGKLFKRLRTEKGLTQEQFAEIMHVSNRTVSRWENGNNLPDIALLIDIADFYEVDLRSLLDGERKSEKMDKQTENTVLKAVEYSNSETEKLTKKIRVLLIIGALTLIVLKTLEYTDVVQSQVLLKIIAFADGAAIGIIVVALLMTGHLGQKLAKIKQNLFKRMRN